MAPSATATQSVNSTKIKRPAPPGIQTAIATAGANSTSSPSPSLSSAKRPSSAAAHPPNSASSNGTGANGMRSATRPRRDGPAQLLGRGQRNSSAGLRSGTIHGDTEVPMVQPQPYNVSQEHILEKYAGEKPSWTIHMHPTNFRFEGASCSFPYKSTFGTTILTHLKNRTVPHERDIMENLLKENVPFYDGCLIVSVHDHKSIAKARELDEAAGGAQKNAPFSVHNPNALLTPSPYVPFSQQIYGEESKKRKADTVDDGREKENMPAPAQAAEAQKATDAKKQPKVYTAVLRSTAQSQWAYILVKANTPREAVPAGAPPTPIAPTTPMEPPAKRQKRVQMEVDSTNIHVVEAQMKLAASVHLFLDPVDTPAECARLLEAYAHPDHSAPPPQPKTRQRTVADLAQEEALAADQERYMLIGDENHAPGATGGAAGADGAGQASNAVPRFESFNTIEKVRAEQIEKERAKKLQQAEAARKAQQEDQAKERARVEAMKREEDAARRRQIQLQQHQQDQRQRAAAAQAEERRRMMAQQQAAQEAARQNQQAMQQQMNQHGHPQQPSQMPNGLAAQSQRFQNQISQAPAASPIARHATATPQNMSSPMVSDTTNMGGMPMTATTSSMGASPPRPGSVVQQNAPMNAGMAHQMGRQPSHQSHVGTPRMSATPVISHPTPQNRPVSATPRMSQPSPMPGNTSQAPQMGPMMGNGMNTGAMTPQQQQILRANMMAQQQQQILAQQQQQQGMQAGGMGGGMGGGMQQGGQQLRPTPQQQHQIHQMRTNIQNAMQTGNTQQAQQLNVQYQAYLHHIAQLQQAQQQNLMNGHPGMGQISAQQLQQMTPQQIQQINAVQQMRRQQAAAAQGLDPRTQQLIMQRFLALRGQYEPQMAAQCGGTIPPEQLTNLHRQLQARARQEVFQAIQNNQAQRAKMMQAQMAQQNAMGGQGMGGQGMGGMGMPGV